MARPSHRVDREIDGIEKRSLSPGLDRQEPVQDLAAATGKVDDPVHTGVELYQGEFVVGIGGLQYVRHRVTRHLEFRTHASARVEDNRDRDRRIIPGKLRNRLLDVIVKNPELLSRKP